MTGLRPLTVQSCDHGLLLGQIRLGAADFVGIGDAGVSAGAGQGQQGRKIDLSLTCAGQSGVRDAQIRIGRRDLGDQRGTGRLPRFLGAEIAEGVRLRGVRRLAPQVNSHPA